MSFRMRAFTDSIDGLVVDVDISPFCALSQPDHITVTVYSAEVTDCEVVDYSPKPDHVISSGKFAKPEGGSPMSYVSLSDGLSKKTERCSNGHEWEVFPTWNEANTIQINDGPRICLRCIAEFCEKNFGIVTDPDQVISSGKFAKAE